MISRTPYISRMSPVKSIPIYTSIRISPQLIPHAYFIRVRVYTFTQGLPPCPHCLEFFDKQQFFPKRIGERLYARNCREKRARSFNCSAYERTNWIVFVRRYCLNTHLRKVWCLRLVKSADMCRDKTVYRYNAVPRFIVPSVQTHC